MNVYSNFIPILVREEGGHLLFCVGELVSFEGINFLYNGIIDGLFIRARHFIVNIRI